MTQGLHGEAPALEANTVSCWDTCGPCCLVCRFVNECLNRGYNAAAGPSHDGQAPDQPDVAGRHVY